MTDIQVVLVDINPELVAAWRVSFDDSPEVTVVQGSITDQPVDAWVTPTNAIGRMDRGLDARIKGYLGPGIEQAVQARIARTYGGAMPVGHATCTPTERTGPPRFLISTRSAGAKDEGDHDALHVALAAAAALQAVHMQNAEAPGAIRSVAVPGLAANGGRVPADACADLMWTAYDLFREAELPDFATVRRAIEGLLGDLGAPSRASYKRSFAQEPLFKSHKYTLPDTTAAQAQLQKKIAAAQRQARAEAGRDDDGDPRSDE